MSPVTAPTTSGAPTRSKVEAVMVGRQNAGKTSLVMQLTGSVQRPVNFPGSSVERGEASVRVGATTLTTVDLPGIASLETISPDEEVALDYLKTGGSDVICVVVDAAKLSVEIKLVCALTHLGRPMVVALNKTDVAASEGMPVDVEALSDELGLPVIATNARSGDGVDALRQALVASAGAAAPRALVIDADAVARRVQRLVLDRRGTLTDRLDQVLLHPLLGMPLLVLIVFGIFQAIFVGADPFMGWIESAQEALADGVAGAMGPGALRSFIIDGLINGVGSVVIFLPQIIMLMLFVSLLEATGYMARAAFILDRLLRGVGLNGRSFVPLVSSFACAVPGILATRIIENERDRIATIVVAPLMSCSARLPVYVVLIGAFFPSAWAGVVLLGLYVMGIVVAASVAWALRRTVLRGEHSVLMMELPVYQSPNWRVVGAQVWSAVREFMVLAGTIIFAASIVIWLLSYYPRPAEIHEGFEARRAAVGATLDPAARDRQLETLAASESAAYLEQSYLARMGKAVHPIFAPAGWDWRTSVGVIAAFPARELIIPTLGILYSLGDVDPGDYELATLSLEGSGGGDGLRDQLHAALDEDGRRAFSPLVALALMVFFALCSQCAATLATIKRETRSWKWPAFTFIYMTVLAWAAAVAVTQIGGALGFG